MPSLRNFSSPLSRPAVARAEQHGHFFRVRSQVPDRLLCQGQKRRHADASRDHGDGSPLSYRLKRPSQRTEHVDAFSDASLGQNLGSAADDLVD